MNRTLLSALSVIVIAFIPLRAQPPTSTPAPSITGTWQGTINYGLRSNRIVVILKNGPDGSLHGGLKYIDDDFGLAFTSITFTAPDLALIQDMTGMAFHGQLSADGRSIAGAFTQGKQSYPLTLSLATPDTLWKSQRPAAMAADADPAFEVAAIKPALPNEIHPSFNRSGPEFHATGTSAAELIKIVYQVRGRQLIDMPPWLEDTKFDITAKSNIPGSASEDQMRIMIKKLLAERFHLVCHTGTQDFPALVMTLDPKGPTPTPSDPDFNAHNAMFYQETGGDIVLHLSGADMPFFLKTLMDRYRDKQIVDQTGLTGAFDIMLRISGGASKTETGSGGTNDEIGVAYLAAAEHAGFKFTSKKVPVPVVIIDHIDPPTPN
ncbi:MAG TPA: TIGR03435 family protein [Acidobacteriaceae bacterium]|nr:TIGR03435 family protein [Acidobacteriaceae bacterium]